jgi:putative transcriptional regulator
VAAGEAAAAARVRGVPSDPVNRRGRLLVAAPVLVDQNFRRAVVLMLEHSDEGALGLVLNRPTPLVSREALPRHIADALDPDEVVHEGGPVQPEAVIVLADFEDPAEAASIAFGSVGILDPTAGPDEPVAGVRAMRAYGGYAGWGAGQLEREIEEEAWIDAPCTVEDVFTDRPEDLWGEVLERKGGPYRLLARMPEDPSLN